MTAPGSFVLHNAVRPAVPDGAYTLAVTQGLSAPGATVAPLERHLVVTGPRFTLPPDQLLSTFPPANATGEFSTRLPQVVLRRRTLPWERRIEGKDAALPWLALVLLADGEGQLVSSLPVDGSGLPDPELRDADTRDVLRVSERVVDNVFPTLEDLPWLCHAREVDLADTELAMGDDDGFLAVVLANRLPQPGVHYTACLVSLEGHGDDLPTTELTLEFFDTLNVYTAVELVTAAGAQRSANALPADVRLTRGAAKLAVDGRQDDTAAAADRRTTLIGTTETATGAAGQRDAWSQTRTSAEQTAREPLMTVTGASAVAGMSIAPQLLDPGLRTVEFTVLAHWSFTCDTGGDFASRMQELDVGMLGTMPPTTLPAAGPAPPPPPRPAPVVLDTGHVAVQSISRRGDTNTAWYRSPLTPRQVDRRQAVDGVLPLLHAADQARRVGPDGREDLTLATAFEIGRLLAVSQPAIVAALLRWRAEGYGRARLASVIASGDLSDRLGAILGQRRPVFGAAVTAGVIAALGGNDAARLGAVRPAVDPPPEIGELKGPLTELVARGFAIDAVAVSDVLGARAPIDAQLTAPAPGVQTADVGAATFAPLATHLDARVASLLRGVKG